MANKIMETASKETKCAHCGEAIGYYSLAGVTIRDGELEWCDTVCYDDWMDAADAAQKAKVESISEFSASIARAAAEMLDKEIMQSFDTENREALAELCHRQWSDWMRYLFKKCDKNEDGTVTIPKWAVGRWSRQMETEYSQLSEDEQLSDRIEADKFLILIEQRG